jgi:serine/threonine-protein kinase
MTGPDNQRVDPDRRPDAEPAAEAPACGPYVLGRVLGRGGMGTVYEARDGALDRRVALKVINRDLAGDPIAEARFLREVRALRRLAHPHVVDVFDVGVASGRPFLVMELLEGETLAQCLAHEERLPLPRAVAVFLPVLSAVAAFHQARVIHRDLKPSNIMLARREGTDIEPVVLDFGIARAEGDGEGDTANGGVLTRSEALVGTLPYLAPEQLRDARSASVRSDLYAVGVMLYECLTGRRPFGGGDRYDLMHAVMTAAIVPPSAIVAGLPAAADAVVLRAMAREAGARFADARVFAAALLPFAEPAVRARWAQELAGAGEPEPMLATAPDARAPRRALVSRAALWLPVLGGVALLLGGAMIVRGRRAVSEPEAPRVAATTPLIAAPPAVASPSPASPPAPPAVEPAPGGGPAGSAILSDGAPKAITDGTSSRARPARRARARKPETDVNGSGTAERAQERSGATERPPPAAGPVGDDDAVDPYAAAEVR